MASDMDESRGGEGLGGEDEARQTADDRLQTDRQREKRERKRGRGRVEEIDREIERGGGRVEES